MFIRPTKKYLPPFCPPRPSGEVIALCKAISGPILHFAYGVSSVSFREEEIERYHNSCKARTLIISNHPSKADPAVLFALSKKVRQNFYYLSNREQFDQCKGLYGRFLQSCGAYSIMRGVQDHESSSKTSEILRMHDAQLVAFPEGGNYSWNDSVSPFQDAFFMLVNRVARESSDSPLWIQPVAIKYDYDRNAENDLRLALERLELALKLEPWPQSDFRERVYRIGETILFINEMRFFHKKQDGTFHERICQAREEMLKRISQQLGLIYKADTNVDIVERARKAFNEFHKVSVEGRLPESGYEQKLMTEDAHSVRPLRKQIDRLANWMALKPGYLSDSPAMARKVDLVTRLEKEVLKRVELRPRSTSTVRLGLPFDVRSLLGENPQKVRADAEAVSAKCEAAVQALLDEMTQALNDKAVVGRAEEPASSL